MHNIHCKVFKRPPNHAFKICVGEFVLLFIMSLKFNQSNELKEIAKDHIIIRSVAHDTNALKPRTLLNRKILFISANA